MISPQLLNIKTLTPLFPLSLGEILVYYISVIVIVVAMFVHFMLIIRSALTDYNKPARLIVSRLSCIGTFLISTALFIDWLFLLGKYPQAPITRLIAITYVAITIAIVLVITVCDIYCYNEHSTRDRHISNLSKRHTITHCVGRIKLFCPRSPASYRPGTDCYRFIDNSEVEYTDLYTNDVYSVIAYNPSVASTTIEAAVTFGPFSLTSTLLLTNPTIVNEFWVTYDYESHLWHYAEDEGGLIKELDISVKGNSVLCDNKTIKIAAPDAYICISLDMDIYENSSNYQTWLRNN